MNARDLLYSTEVTLTERPVSLSAVLRPSWRVPVTVLLVDACRSKRARREQLVVLNWAVRSAGATMALVQYVQGNGHPHDVGVRYEPALVRAVNLAVGAGLLTRADNAWVEVSSQGRKLLDLIREHGLYERERECLGMLDKPLPFSTAENLLRGRP